jgi:basic membrane protein A
MKKVLVFLLVCLVSITGLLASGSTEQKEAVDDGKLNVCVVYTGNLGDKSYNDSCNIGSQRALEEFGINLKSLEGTTADEWKSNLLSACEDGYDLIICAASNLQPYLQEFASLYPNTKFAIIDTVVDAPNVQSISFAQNQGSFLAGAAAAMFTEKSNIEGVNDESVIGWVGGMDIPVLQDFYTGYDQGAKYINPNITILRSFAGSWNDPLKGKELALAQFEQGADVVMNVASGTGPGILEAAKESGHFAIGVDLNQDNDQPGSVLTSMVKRVDSACYLTIKSVVEDKFQGGSTSYLTLEDGGISLTDFAVIKQHLGNDFPEEILENIAIINDKIISGEIVVTNYPGFGPQAN